MNLKNSVASNSALKTLIRTSLLLGLAIVLTACGGSNDSAPPPQQPGINLDTDGDGVADSSDNCINTKNPDQSDTNNNKVGDICDSAPVAGNDSITVVLGQTISILDSRDTSVLKNDNDAEQDPLTALLVTNATTGQLILNSDGSFSYTATTSSGTDSFTYTANDGSSDSNIATVDITITPPSVASDINGIWRLQRTFTTTSTTPNTHPLCNGNDDYVYLSVSQNKNNTLDVTAHTGDISTGAINSDSSFSLSGVKQWMDAGKLSNQIAVTYSGSTDGSSMNGTYKEVYSLDGNIVCDREMNFDGFFVYKPTGTEMYSSMYATESKLNDITNGVSQRDSSTLQLEVNGGNSLTVYSIKNVTMTQSDFNPNTGIATFTLTWTVTPEDFDNDGKPDTGKDFDNDGIPDIAYFTEDHTLLFVRAPDDSSGLPVIVGSSTGSAQIALASGLNTQPLDFTQSYYSKPVTSSTFTRTSLLPASGGTDKLFYNLGIANPPLKNYSRDTASTVEIADSTGTNLCSNIYRTKYQQIVRLPFPDMSTESFSTGFYSFVFCGVAATNQNAPTNGTAYNIIISDSATPGVSNTFAVTAKILDAGTAPSVIPNRRGINVNSALSSKTRRSSIIPIFGYFAPQLDIPVNWGTTVNNNVDQYQLRFKLENDPIRDYRVITKAANAGTPPTNTLLPADTLLNIAGYANTKIKSKLVERINSNGFGLAHSRFLKIQPGLRGMINIEVSNLALNDSKVFQLFVRDQFNDFTVIGCALTHSFGYDAINPISTPTCSDGTLDFASATLSIANIDFGQGVAYDLNIAFSNAKLGTAILTVAGVNTEVWMGQAKIVNPELMAYSDTTYNTASASFIKSTALSYINPQPYARSAQLVSRNASLPGEPNNARVVWDDTDNIPSTDYAQRYGSFRVAPLWTESPVNTQTTITHVTSRFSATGYLANDRYTITTYGGSIPTPAQPQSVKQRYGVDYASPTTMVFPVAPPLRSNFSINGTRINGQLGATATFNNPFDVTSSGMTSLSWIYSFTGMDINTIRWQIRSRRVVADINPPNGPKVVSHELIQTKRLVVDGTQLSYDPATGIWAWQVPPEFSLNVGEIRKINVRASNPDGTVRIQSQGLYITNP